MGARARTKVGAAIPPPPPAHRRVTRARRGAHTRRHPSWTTSSGPASAPHVRARAGRPYARRSVRSASSALCGARRSEAAATPLSQLPALGAPALSPARCPAAAARRMDPPRSLAVAARRAHPARRADPARRTHAASAGLRTRRPKGRRMRSTMCTTSAPWKPAVTASHIESVRT